MGQGVEAEAPGVEDPAPPVGDVEIERVTHVHLEDPVLLRRRQGLHLPGPVVLNPFARPFRVKCLSPIDRLCPLLDLGQGVALDDGISRPNIAEIGANRRLGQEQGGQDCQDEDLFHFLPRGRTRALGICPFRSWHSTHTGPSGRRYLPSPCPKVFLQTMQVSRGQFRESIGGHKLISAAPCRRNPRPAAACLVALPRPPSS